MRISQDEYYRMAHLYLETESGRVAVFDLLRRRAEDALEAGRIDAAVGNLNMLGMYMKGAAIEFVNMDLPNVFTLRNKREQIRHDAVAYFGTVFELVERVLLSSVRADHRSDTLFLLAKYAPSVPGIPTRRFVDVQLLLFHTLMTFDDSEGEEDERRELGRLAMRFLCRYDCSSLGAEFILTPWLREELKEATLEYPPYERYVGRLREVAARLATPQGAPMEDLLPVFLTDHIFVALDSEQSGKTGRLLSSRWDEILAFLGDACLRVLQQTETRQRLITRLIPALERRRDHTAKARHGLEINGRAESTRQSAMSEARAGYILARPRGEPQDAVAETTAGYLKTPDYEPRTEDVPEEPK